MGYIDSTSATISSVLTQMGRVVLARNDGSFRITKFKVADDEINYQLYNPANVDTEDADIIAIPILEPSTNQDTALRFPLVTLPEGTQRVAELVVQPNNILVDLNAGSQVFTMVAQTLYNQDIHYVVSFANINSTFVSSVSLVKATDTSAVLNQSSANVNQFLVNTTNTLQQSNATWNVSVILSNLSSAVLTSTQNVLLFTMLISGQQSGAFTSIDIFGNVGATSTTQTGTTQNQTQTFINTTKTNSSGGVQSGGAGNITIGGNV